MPNNAIATADVVDDGIAALQRDWQHLSLFQRGERLNGLAVHLSTRELAKLLNCSPKLIRDSLIFASIPPSERPRAGKYGRKQLLAIIRDREKRMGRSQRFRRRSVRRHLYHKLVKTLRDWFIAEMPPNFWDFFCHELLRNPATIQEIKSALPRRWQECDIDGDWDTIIANSRPSGDPVTFSDSIFGFWVHWFAYWYPRCMPLADIRERAFLRVRKQLREKTPDHPDWQAD